jgi:GTP-binding protein EngB required for normal cell division
VRQHIDRPNVVGRSGLTRWLLHFERESIASTGNSLDRVLTEDLAQRAHLHLQVVLLDDHPRPDQVEQLALRDQAIAVLDQREEKIESARTQLDRLAVLQQQARVRTQLEAAETMARDQGLARIGGLQRLRPNVLQPRGFQNV